MKWLIFLFACLMLVISAFAKEYNQSYEEKLIDDLEGIYTREAVITPDNPAGHPVCATSIILQARHDLPYLSEETQKTVTSLFSRPSLEFYYDSPAGYFRIHYDTGGVNKVYQPYVDNNGNGVPDYVDNCADILDYVWSIEVDSLGYDPPPSDGWYPVWEDNGGDGKYDIYLRNLGSSYLGATYPETTEFQDQVWTSHMELDNDYLGYPPFHEQYDWLKVTAAHEFFHTIHFGYDAFEAEVDGATLKPYWMEMTATWMEDMVFDDVNDYKYYLPDFFNKPWLSLRNFDELHPYGACVWPIFLSERFESVDIIKEIWTVCALEPGDNVLAAFDQILKAAKYGSSLNNAFREFTVWNYFTADRANPEEIGFYSEGPSFWYLDNPTKVKETDIHDVITSTYPINDSSVSSQLPENLGANYIVFEPFKDSIGGLRIFFDGDLGNVEWSNSLIGFQSSDKPPTDTTFQNGLGVMFDWVKYSEIVMIIARSDTNTQYFTYRYTAEFDSSLGNWIPPDADRVFQNCPNPFVIIDDNSTTGFPLILKEATDVKLSVFSIAGELVWQKVWLDKIGEYTPAIFQDRCESIPFKWDGRNMNGEYVASGIYIYQVVTNNASEIKKMVVINER